MDEMGKRIITVSCIILVSFCIKSQAQVNQIFYGSRSEALCNASVSIIDAWSVYNNQALLGSLESPIISIGHHSGLINEMNIEAIAFAYPTKTGTIAASYSYYGSKYYNENNVGLAFGRKFGKFFSLGIRINYIHVYQVGNYKDTDNASFDVGVAYTPIQNLIIAAQVYNPVNLTKQSNEYGLSSSFRFGASYRFKQNVLISGELEKEYLYDLRYKFGIEGRFKKYFSVSGGVGSNPFKYSFGCGLYLKKFQSYFAFVRHTSLGYKPSFTLAYNF